MRGAVSRGPAPVVAVLPGGEMSSVPAVESQVVDVLLESSVDLVECCPGSSGVVEPDVPSVMVSRGGVVLGKGMPEINLCPLDPATETTAERQFYHWLESEGLSRRTIGCFFPWDTDVTRNPVKEWGLRQPRRAVQDVVGQTIYCPV